MTFTLNDVGIFVAGYDLRGSVNKLDLSAKLDTEDVTTFASTDANGKIWQEVTGGITGASVKAEGFADFSGAESDSFSRLGYNDALSVMAGTTVGSTAYLTNLQRGKFAILGKVGAVCPWSIEGSSTWPLVRGQLAHAPGTARTSNGSGTALVLGARSATQRLYAALHVYGASGAAPTLDVVIESDATDGFGSPTTQLTFSQASTVSGQASRASVGAETDTYYRAKWTVGGANPSFLFAVTFGIF